MSRDPECMRVLIRRELVEAKRRKRAHRLSQARLHQARHQLRQRDSRQLVAGEKTHRTRRRIRGESRRQAGPPLFHIMYVSVNAVLPGRSRTRRAVASIRHVFLEEDIDGPGLLAALTTRPDLPPPSYVLHSSPGRLHVLWRARGFERSGVERLQKDLASQLHTDPAATSCSQTTRLPGFMNHKHERPWPVWIEYLRPDAALAPADFPAPRASSRRTVGGGQRMAGAVIERDDRLKRARRFLRSVEPAIAGQHGDLHTFRICCRVIRGFALSDDEALSLLRE